MADDNLITGAAYETKRYCHDATCLPIAETGSYPPVFGSLPQAPAGTAHYRFWWCRGTAAGCCRGGRAGLGRRELARLRKMVTTPSKLLPMGRRSGLTDLGPGYGAKSSQTRLPRRVGDYFDRPELLGRCRPRGRGFTVLQAPCGFGKTALLNEICHRERDDGRLVAWLRLDSDMNGAGLCDYLAHAFACEGLDFGQWNNLWAGYRQQGQTHLQAGLLLRAIEEYGGQCLLALDEVELLVAEDAVALLDYVLRRTPANLHVALALRSNPRGLDVASILLDYEGTQIDEEQLRFSDVEIGRFFGSGSSRGEFVELVERTEGWPVALRLYRRLRERGGAGRDHPYGLDDQTLAFLGDRLLRGLGESSRQLLFDLALFDKVDRSLADKLLATDHLDGWEGLRAGLRGLIRPADATGRVLHLHPIVKAFCAERFRQEDSARYHGLNGALATVLLRDGDCIAALRHARQAEDEALVCEIVEELGAVCLLVQVGAAYFQDICGALDAPLAGRFPRLRLVRCIGFALAGNSDAAWSLYKETARDTDNFRRDREGGDPLALRAEGVVAQAMVFALAGHSVGDFEFQRLRDEAAGLVADHRLPTPVRGTLHALLAALHQQCARFDDSRQHTKRAKECYALGGTPGGVRFAELQQGVVAMVEGRVGDAMDAYRNPGSTGTAAILLAELHIERNGRVPGFSWTAVGPGDTGPVIPTFDVRAAEQLNRLERAFERGGVGAALSAVEDAFEQNPGAGRSGLMRLLLARRVAYLVTAGRTEQAQRAWREGALPEDVTGVLDLAGQSWREMEAIACARIGLLGALGDLAGARGLARKLCAAASSGGLARIHMRGLAAWMILEHKAAQPDAAVAVARQFLKLFRHSDYSRSLAQDRPAAGAVLRQLLATGLATDARQNAERLLLELDGRDNAPPPDPENLKAREIDVLNGLARGLRDKEIARELGLTVDGVRYHLKNIYRKTGAAGRVDAVRRARALSTFAK